MPTNFHDDDEANWENEEYWKQKRLNEPKDPSTHNYQEHSDVYRRLNAGVNKVYDRNKHLWDEVAGHLDDARINANDTVQERKKDRPSQKDWDDLLTGTLSSVLNNSDPSEKAKAHWKAHGISW